jgi:predicted nucleic acid-binding protein
VIDTNVIVSGLRSNRGPAFRILRAVGQGIITPVVSVPLCMEYEDVLSRPGLVPHSATPGYVDKFLDVFLLRSECRDVFFRWRPWLPDPKDECVLEIAVAAGNIPIITSNLRDFKPAHLLGVAVIPPSRLCELLALL